MYADHAMFKTLCTGWLLAPFAEGNIKNCLCYGIPEKHMFGKKKRVAVRDIGPFILAKCTGSRGGPHGSIAGPQNPPKAKHNNEITADCAKGWRVNHAGRQCFVF